MATSVSQPPPPPSSAEALQSVHTSNLPALFAQWQMSLVVSTYQARVESLSCAMMGWCVCWLTPRHVELPRTLGEGAMISHAFAVSVPRALLARSARDSARPLWTDAFW